MAHAGHNRKLHLLEQEAALLRRRYASARPR
jgi:hypothetical protein